MSDQNERLVPLGQHLVHIDGDTVFVTVRGAFTGKDMQQLIEHFASIKREHGALFVCYDGRQCMSVDAAARKYASAERSSDNSADLRVIFGISFALRVILNMILRAQMTLFNLNTAVHVFDKEQDARFFLEVERGKYAAKKVLTNHLEASKQQRAPVE